MSLREKPLGLYSVAGNYPSEMRQQICVTNQAVCNSEKFIECSKGFFFAVFKIPKNA